MTDTQLVLGFFSSNYRCNRSIIKSMRSEKKKMIQGYPTNSYSGSNPILILITIPP